VWSPPDPGRGVEGGSADDAGRRGGGGLEGGWVLVGSWRAPKIMGARPHSESTQNNGGVPSSCGRFGDFLLFFIAAKS
jgi:hypothetical protein